MKPTENDTEANSQFDTLQEVGQYAVDNDQTLGKIEDAVTKLHGGLKTKEIMLPLDQAKADFIATGRRYAELVEAGKQEYGIT